jgi:hypothetical protein
VTCSKCRKEEAAVKFKGSLLCASCLVNAVRVGIPGAEKLLVMLRRAAVKRRIREEKAKAASA